MAADDRFWALARRLLRDRPGRGARRHRAQRRRQDHAAQDPHPHHRADRGRDRDPRPRRQPARGRHRLPPGAHRPGEHLPERRDPRHEPPGDRRTASTRSSPSPRSRSSSTPRSSATRAACTSASPSPSPPTSSRTILVVDEVLAVGDASFQKKCLDKMGEVGGRGRTVLFVSHNLTAVQSLCGRSLWLRMAARSGRAIREIVRRYLMDGIETGAAREWAAKELAPGNDQVRFRVMSISPACAAGFRDRPRHRCGDHLRVLEPDRRRRSESQPQSHRRPGSGCLQHRAATGATLAW